MITFTIDEEQAKKMKEFVDKYRSPNVGAIGGQFVYTFCPTTLGTVVKVRDDISGEELDVTDYWDW